MSALVLAGGLMILATSAAEAVRVALNRMLATPARSAPRRGSGR